MKYFLKVWPPLVFIRQVVEYWAWKFKGSKGAAAHLYKQKVLKEYAHRYSLSTLVETGTYLGDMVFAMRKRFSEIHSIEISPEYFERAKQRFSSYKNIHILEGDSGKVLSELVPSLKSGVLFWLDGHYSGGSTGRGDADSPVIIEVKSILEKMSGAYAILIDDARLFVGKDGYPKYEDLVSQIKALKSDMQVEKEKDIIRIFPKL